MCTGWMMPTSFVSPVELNVFSRMARKRLAILDAKNWLCYVECSGVRFPTRILLSTLITIIYFKVCVCILYWLSRCCYLSFARRILAVFAMGKYSHCQPNCGTRTNINTRNALISRCFQINCLNCRTHKFQSHSNFSIATASIGYIPIHWISMVIGLSVSDFFSYRLNEENIEISAFRRCSSIRIG